LGEVGVLGEEAVARVDGVRAGLLGDLEDLGDVEVGVGGSGAAERVGLVGQPDEQRVTVGVGVDGDTADPGVPAGTDHADRDLTTVGDQDLLQRPRALRRLGHSEASSYRNARQSRATRCRASTCAQI
jgi:hypothetical protein